MPAPSRVFTVSDVAGIAWRWRGGARTGEPKISPVAQGLLDRGLMRPDIEGRLPRLFFTEPGLVALRAIMMDRRFAEPGKFAHVRQELGIDPTPDNPWDGHDPRADALVADRT